MKLFFNRLFTKGTVENRLLISLLPVTIVVIGVDHIIDRATLDENPNWILLSFVKLMAALPVLGFVIFYLAKLLDHRLSDTRIALEKSEEKFRTIFESNSTAILIIEKDSTISMVNNAYCRMTGYMHDEVEGQSWTKFIPESELPRLKEFNRLRYLQSPELPSVYEFLFNKKDGETRVGLMSVFFDPRLNQIVISIADITERKEMENSLHESREQYRKLVELQGEGLVIVDQEERYIFANPAADRIMGVPSGSLVGRKINGFVSEATLDQIKKQTELRSTGNRSTYEMDITRPDGEKRVLLITATPNFNKAGEFESSLGIFLDITDRKNIENELKKNESALKALNTTKDKLFSIIAHDLRGPVGTSADLLEVMIESYESFSGEEQLKMLEILKNSAKSTFNLLETLLSWSVIQTGNIVFKPELFNLTKCIETIVGNMVPTAFSKNITLRYEPKDDIYTYADQNMIQTVFRNLIGNAIKFTFRGGTVEIKAVNQGDKTEISISDNGVGMDEETRRNLFILDKQHSRYGTENEKGTGLGLILCKEFIERHGGHIHVESEKGNGSNFIFDIPKVFNQVEPHEQKTDNERPDQKKFDNELILIVEDEDINFQVLSSILNSVNLKYERAENGRKAVDMFLHNNYRLILMDIQLSEMNGWEATMKIRENDSEIPIIAVTAYASDPTRKKSLEVGCNDFITKPINKTRLIQLIDKYLQRSRISTTLYK
jgi:PAS domain S-box-containing protein